MGVYSGASTFSQFGPGGINQMGLSPVVGVATMQVYNTAELVTGRLY
jgi:hypothetical protein